MRGSALVLAAFLGLCAPAAALSFDYESALALLASKDYAGALSALESEPDPVLRLDGEAELYFEASDPAAALRAAEAGLALDPNHLNLRFRAALSSLWLGAGERALGHARALQQALEQAPLTEQQRELWRGAAADYAAEAQRLLQHAQDREHTVGRARLVSLVGLATLAIGLAWALCAPRR